MFRAAAPKGAPPRIFLVKQVPVVFDAPGLLSCAAAKFKDGPDRSRGVIASGSLRMARSPAALGFGDSAAHALAVRGRGSVRRSSKPRREVAKPGRKAN
jgi:hypothetical protein